MAKKKTTAAPKKEPKKYVPMNCPKCGEPCDSVVMETLLAVGVKPLTLSIYSHEKCRFKETKEQALARETKTEEPKPTEQEEDNSLRKAYDEG